MAAPPPLPVPCAAPSSATASSPAKATCRPTSSARERCATSTSSPWQTSPDHAGTRLGSRCLTRVSTRSAEALLAAEANSLDFVDISTPPCDHAAIAHLALDAGLHVLCEKPLTTTVGEARSLLEHARRAKRVLFPCHNYKHAPVVKAIREAIGSGRIGRVRSVTLSTFRNTHAKGVPEWNTDWRRQRRYSGGGIAMDHGSHSFYLAFEWMGSYPSAVTAKMSNLEPNRWDTEDNFSAVLTFPTGLAHAHLSWTAGVRKVIYSVQGERGGGHRRGRRPRTGGDGAHRRAGGGAGGRSLAHRAKECFLGLDGCESRLMVQLALRPVPSRR